MKFVFDIGGSNTRIGISEDGASLREVETLKTNPDFEKAMEEMAKVVKKMVGRDRITMAGGGVAGVFDDNHNKLMRSPNLTGWEKKPLKKQLTEIAGVPVYINNDAAMGGLGEAVMGAGRRKQIVAFLTMGTGIGGVKVVDGKISPVAVGSEPGHQIIDVNGKVGYWEEFASGGAMEAIFNKKPEDIDDPTIWEQEARLVAVGVHNIILLWSPETLIFSGGLMKKLKIEKIKENVALEMEMFPKLPEMVLGELGEKAGLYGSLAYLKQVNGGY